MRLFLAVFCGKVVGAISRMVNAGSGTAWAGKTALAIYPSFISHLSRQLPHRIIVAGTNGKTTTTAMIAHILLQNGNRVVHNVTGANLRNGIAGSLVSRASFTGNLHKEAGVFEVDEAELKHVLGDIKPTVIVLLNLFRDQLDRYGELDAIAQSWKSSLASLPKETTLVLNADDPLVSSVGSPFNGTVSYFGLSKGTKKYTADLTADSSYCVSCGSKLSYEWISYAHLGKWLCKSCKAHRPRVKQSTTYNPLEGTYNMYNSLAALLASHVAGVSHTDAVEALESFMPVFGRQESLDVNGTCIEILLSKNPAGFNESMNTILAKTDHPIVMLALNDRIVDGTDVSWIWDTDMESLAGRAAHIICTGDRAWDMGVRVKYAANSKPQIVNRSETNQSINNITIEQDLKKAIEIGLKKTAEEETLYILPTYSAMLDIRKILTGRKI